MKENKTTEKNIMKYVMFLFQVQDSCNYIHQQAPGMIYNVPAISTFKGTKSAPHLHAKTPQMYITPSAKLIKKSSQMQSSRSIIYIWASGKTREFLFLITDVSIANSAALLKWKKGLNGKPSSIF